MAYYNATQEFGPYSPHDGPITFRPSVGSGSLTLSYKVGDNWVDQETISENVAKIVAVAGMQWKVTVSGNATFEWDN